MHEYTITDKGVMDEHCIEEYFEKIMEDKNAKWYRQGIRDEYPKVYKQHEKIG